MVRPKGPIGSALRAGNGLLLAIPVALFPFAVGTDVAYLRTAELQWTNFSAWSITIGLVFGGVALIVAVLGAVLHLRSASRRLRLLYAGALAVMCLLGLVNAFKHSQDGWSSVGGVGLALSVITALAALVAGAIAYSGRFDEADAA